MKFLAHNSRRLIFIVRALVFTIKKKGGFFRTLKTVVSIFGREGINGIKHRVLSINAKESTKIAKKYSEWVHRYDSIPSELKPALIQKIDSWDKKPLISIVMPVFNPNPKWLIEAIQSVENQIYPHWELCVSDDLSTDPEILLILNQYAKTNPRIKVVFRAVNGHISAASNSALELAVGEWVALLDHDDVLPEQALYWVAHAINTYPSAKLIYSDEDKLDKLGNRYDPYFKCDWNVDLFYSHNMFCHLGVFRKDVIDTIGGFQIGMEGSQDYDLVLRCLELVDADTIVHIPRILYHWRAHEASTAMASDSKPYAQLASEKALREHFSRLEIKVSVSSSIYGNRVKYELPEELPLVSLIIPTRNGLDLIRSCVESIIGKTSYPDYEIVIVDNNSDDPKVLAYFELIGLNPKVRVIKDDRPFNYSQLNNSAIMVAKGDIIALVNNDIEVISPDWLSEMVSHALRPGVGVVGAKLLYPDGSIQHAGVVIGIGGVAGHSHKHFSSDEGGYFSRLKIISSYSAVTAACLVVEKAVYLKVGGLDEENLTVAFNDVDFCLRVLKAGYRNIWTPYAELYHHESVSRGHEDTTEKKARFRREVEYMKGKWGAELDSDPAYSPNLTSEYEDFSLAWPPRVTLEGD